MDWDNHCCPSCRTYDSLVPLGPNPQTVTTPDGRKFSIVLHRCVVCGLEEGVRRTWREEHKDDQPNGSGALAADGLLFIPRPYEEVADDGQ